MGRRPPGRPALRSQRRHRRHDAGLRPRTRRDDLRLHDHLADLRDDHASVAERHQHDRRTDRVAVLRGHRDRDLCTVRRRPRAVLLHAAGQQPRRHRRQQVALRGVDGDLMTDITLTAPVAPPVVRSEAPATPPTPRRLNTSGWTAERVAQLLASAAGALALVWLVFERLLPLSGLVGFWLTTYVVFVGLYAATVATTEGRVVMRDRLAAVMFTSAGVLLGGVLILVIAFTAVRGWQAVVHSNFFTQTTALTQPDAPLNQGGVY